MSMESWIGMPGLIAPAVAAGLLVASTHVPLGREVLKRGIIFLDLAVAQIAGLGAVAAAVLLDWTGTGGQMVTFASALGAAFVFSWLEKRGQSVQEAFIGCAFVLAASLAILLLAGNPHGNEDISNLMAGQILWTGWTQIGWAALIYTPLLALMLARPLMLGRFFYPVFAACITVSVQMVGVYLVFASLILPALASNGLPGAKGLLTGYAAALIAVTGGLFVSLATDLPSGPVLVCAYAVTAFGLGLLRRVSQAAA
jgi:zinc/manganese transport system permease protein